MLALPALGFLKTIVDFWNKLPSPVKVIIIGLIFGFVCFKMGERKQIHICQAEKAASIAEAKRIDNAAAETARKNAEAQAEKYRTQALAAENKLNEAAVFYKSLPDACKADDDFLTRNNSIDDSSGVQSPIPGNKKRTPAGR